VAAHDAAEVEQLLARLRAARVRIEDLEIGRADLEDVFLGIMQGAAVAEEAA
jgi:ABC-2 type transport system ATP-binding protein